MCLAYKNILRVAQFYQAFDASASKFDTFLSGPPRVSQSGVELEKNFECDFMASEDAYGSYKTYGRVRLTFGPL